MVRLTLLAGAIVALGASLTGPAQASVLPEDLATSATATVQRTATGVTGTVKTTVDQVGVTASTVTRPTAPPAGPAVQSATRIAQPAAELPSQVVGRVTTPRAGDGQPPAEISSSAGRAARAGSPRGRGHVGASAAQGGQRAALAHPLSKTAPATHSAGVESEPRHFQPPANDGGSSRPDLTPPSGSGGSVASAPAGAFAAGGLALLAAAFSLAGPPLRRRLLIRPAALRPVAFVSLLERPG
jgi:hypothetical protein